MCQGRICSWRRSAVDGIAQSPDERPGWAWCPGEGGGRGPETLGYQVEAGQGVACSTEGAEACEKKEGCDEDHGISGGKRIQTREHPRSLLPLQLLDHGSSIAKPGTFSRLSASHGRSRESSVPQHLPPTVICHNTLFVALGIFKLIDFISLLA